MKKGRECDYDCAVEEVLFVRRGDIDWENHGQQVFTNFAKAHFRELVQKAVARYGSAAESAAGIFSVMDIRLRKNPRTKKYQYFVNDFSLFPEFPLNLGVHQTTPGTFIDTFGRLLMREMLMWGWEYGIN